MAENDTPPPSDGEPEQETVPLPEGVTIDMVNKVFSPDPVVNAQVARVSIEAPEI